MSQPPAVEFFAEERRSSTALPIAAETFFSLGEEKSVTFQGMGRAPTTMNNDSTGSVEPLQSIVVEGETGDIKTEDVSLSVSTNPAPNSSETPQKMKPRRALYFHLPSVKKEALSNFTETRQNIYQFDDLGDSQQGGEVMTCECVLQKSGIYAYRR